MEFGQRALGNRSVLVDPRKVNFNKINQKQFRDFWMPFTPTILMEDVTVLINKKMLFAFYDNGFFTNRNNKDNIIAAIHPADQTTRPQMLKKDNKDYYDLILKFKKITKVGALLNTSFNLHGDAIVETADQAYQTFLNLI